MSIDFRKYLDKHIESGKEISLIYKKSKNAKEEFLNCDSIKVEHGLVKDFAINTGTAKEANISLEIFIFNYNALVELVRKNKRNFRDV